MYCSPPGRGPSLWRRFLTWLSIVRSYASNASPNTAAPGLAGAGVDDEVEVVEHEGRRSRSHGQATEHGADAGDEFARLERLGDVGVRTALQTRDPGHAG